MYMNSGSFGLPSQLAIGPAIRTAEAWHYPDAHGLVARRYAERGYISSDLSTHADGSVVVCSAFEGPATVGTIAVRYDSAQGLNADTVFAPELCELRSRGQRMCEFSRLALDQYVNDSKSLLGRLFHLAYLHAHRLGGAELAVIEVNPRHVAFYRRMLGFKVCAEARLNLRVNAPAVLMAIDLSYMAEQIRALGGSASSTAVTRSFYPHFYGAGDEAAILSKLRQ
ncbi:N-acyl amino acid synthase FeeM domain-containing protein [Roseateles oligotrophus]|uniref:Long-chain N-acyl amino acid synthase n=1 Tax=Roseateles oligotrophus TaxID=1769250 RepID=A0ABT2YC97_9BURK|nr:long-chain N-acyl amino acid synthase [Roseateles oligotrophus]MCV2367660.1 long-chain N-acyl amino acid synthase [Roseateles oligotrophus]